MTEGRAAADQGRGFTGRDIGALALLVLALMCEGFDLQAMNFAGPALVKALGMPKSSIGPLLSASLLGVFFGAPLLGSLGDRLGRKRLIVIGCAAFGLLSLGLTVLQGYWALAGLRFLTGLGLGAALPNALALATELSPNQPAKVTALVVMGIPLGSTLAGAVATALIPAYGWQALFLVGGLLPLLIAFLLWALLPDSPVRPASLAEATPPPGFFALFEGRMALITPLIWISFIGVLMTIYLLAGWIPLVLDGPGLSSRQGYIAGTGYHFGGIIGAVVVALMLGKRSWLVIGLLLVGACASLGVLAGGIASPVLLMTAIIVAGAFVTGTQTAINGATSVTYPADRRAAGLGWAFGIGRLGSIAGPLVGSAAALLGMVEPRQFFLLPLIPLGLAAAAALGVHRLLSRP